MLQSGEQSVQTTSTARCDTEPSLFSRATGPFPTAEPPVPSLLEATGTPAAPSTERPPSAEPPLPPLSMAPVASAAPVPRKIPPVSGDQCVLYFVLEDVAIAGVRKKWCNKVVITGHSFFCRATHPFPTAEPQVPALLADPVPATPSSEPPVPSPTVMLEEPHETLPSPELAPVAGDDLMCRSLSAQTLEMFEQGTPAQCDS